MTGDWKPLERSDRRIRTPAIVESTGSTNVDLAEGLRAGVAPGEALVARHQTAGRGRQGRTWLDRPDASLLMSFSVRTESSVAGLLPLITGLAAVDAVRAIGPDVAVVLKWPNDVLVAADGTALDGGDREPKLAGILAEAVSADASGTVAVVGMGMNIEATPDVDTEAAHLTDLVGQSVDRAALADRVLDGVEDLLVLAEAGPAGRATVLDRYRAVCISIGRRVRFRAPAGDLTGEVVGIADDGRLRLRDADGTVHDLSAGDVHHAR